MRNKKKKTLGKTSGVFLLQKVLAFYCIMWYIIDGERRDETLAKQRLAVTVEDYILKRLVEEAQAQNRNLSNYVETLLIKALAEEDSENK